jgi:para-aminobenzoate synthetase component I
MPGLRIESGPGARFASFHRSSSAPVARRPAPLVHQRVRDAHAMSSATAAAQPLVEPLDYTDPAAAFGVFADDPQAVFLDSAQHAQAQGRYSYIAPAPFSVLTSKDDGFEHDGRIGSGDPFAVLRAALAAHRLQPVAGVPPFQGGAAGYFGYELAQHLERLPLAAGDELRFPDLALGFHDVVIAFDHHARRAWICSSGLPEPPGVARRAWARSRRGEIGARLRNTPPLASPRLPSRPIEVRSNFTRAAYEAAVQRVIDYILAGDIFQANLSQRFSAELPAQITPYDLYRRQRALNPAPFAAYLKFDDLVIASASPERFLRLSGDSVETCPIKGTRPRGKTPAEDRALAAALEASEKDRAENVMIVDLLRNDLSRVCRDGTVDVPALCELEGFATVFHLVSTVTGALREGAGAIDLLAACFPGGSITGAPKIRAMEIIAELEPTRRGPYCGSVGWLGFDGGMDTSIVIRTYALRGQRVSFQAGGGIVADSRPADEYEETLAKAAALIAGLAPEQA